MSERLQRFHEILSQTESIYIAMCELEMVIAEAVRTDQSLMESEARLNAIFQTAAEGILTTDDDGRIESANPAVERIFGYKIGELIGRPISLILDDANPKEATNGTIIGQSVRGHHKDGRTIDIEISISEVPLGDRRIYTGVIRDVSERKRLEASREQLIEQLQHALKQVKLLSGLLPICASCKRIRNESGGWTQLEQYITNHSDAQFGHGLRPECCEKLYPSLEAGGGDAAGDRR